MCKRRGSVCIIWGYVKHDRYVKHKTKSCIRWRNVGRSRSSRRLAFGFLGVRLAVGTGSDAETIAQSQSQAGPKACFGWGWVVLAGATNSGQTLFVGCLAHTAGVEWAVEIAAETTAAVWNLRGLGSRRLGHFGAVGVALLLGGF